ncbi:uncharacterized protein LOC110036624 [Phalaenopsis equestris]|uniref:uncharacterized protein LOC110036624 n=1 Tax=Phalaenopsis equestris TaxID=78828 RepID=UPI0009E54789|nr:uncharacterized protein LOC110036624 [Phalaenopsis equestris]
MGKRKERRLAAMSAANRRVKLDLLAEPSEEANYNSINEEAGVNQEHDHSASAPPSPSSSGHNKENPLLLLGQYSDDELDDEVNVVQKDADDTDYSTGSEEKEQAVASENLGNNKYEVIEASICKRDLEEVGSPKELKANDGDAIKNTCVDVEHSEAEPLSQTCEPKPSENQAKGHINEHWKLVLHEESNQYYYWNTTTGETSWEVPADLAVEARNRDERSVCSANEESIAKSIEAHTFTNENVHTGICDQVLSADGHETSNFISKDTEGYENMELRSARASDSCLSTGQYCLDSVTASYSNLSGYSNLSEHIELHHALSNEETDVNLPRPSGCCESEDAHASQLMKHGEALLQRLAMLYRSAQQFEGYEGIKKEIDIRISDCRALSSYGSSLLPFWWHIDVQLKQIESAINKIEASNLVQTEEFSDFNARQMAPLQLSNLDVTEKDHELIVSTEFVTDKIKNENDDIERASPETNLQLQGSEHQPKIVPDAILISDSSFAAPTLVHSAEDDMDVEMEIDEETSSPPKSNTDCLCISEQLPNESIVPPLPEEEWIPPPPSDVEPIPPPPPPEGELNSPEEPSAPFPSSNTETMIYPFPDQCNVGYHIPAYGYYSSSVAEVSNGNYYGIAGGSQFSESDLPAYYEPLASASSELSSCVAAVGSATYYDVANVSISSGTVLSSKEPSAFYVESSAVNYQDFAPVSVYSSVVDLHLDSPGNYLPKVSKEPQLSTLQASSSLSTVRALGASSGNDSSLDPQPPVVSKNQSKVVRSKKRTVAVAPTLRSNKKVSSLVDKWKAAKEELHEEEEPESALEILEKKRQKEIEGWHARQIATGEAQDNANFVPLGGDWRERVKRRTARARAEDAQTSTATVVDKEKKQPDLIELSKDLPSGWQAYWDDSTKKLYYGNLTTSETTWNRPTR